jgi:hypothetical protein
MIDVVQCRAPNRRVVDVDLVRIGQGTLDNSVGLIARLR